jgi:hypothetical protein
MSRPTNPHPGLSAIPLPCSGEGNGKTPFPKGEVAEKKYLPPMRRWPKNTSFMLEAIEKYLPQAWGRVPR